MFRTAGLCAVVVALLATAGGCFSSDGDSGDGHDMGGTSDEAVGMAGASGDGDGDGDDPVIVGDGDGEGDGDTDGLGVQCGDTTCPAGLVCCDHCVGFCSDPMSNIACPDESDPGRACESDPTGDDGAVACGPGATGKPCEVGASGCCDGLVSLSCDAGCTGTGSCFGVWSGAQNDKLCGSGNQCEGDDECKGGKCCAGPLGMKSCQDVTECLPQKCNSPDTPIATPDGDRPVAELGEGDLVYSMHGGQLSVVPLIAVRSLEVSGHAVVRVELDNGAVLEISSTHPTADGRSFAELSQGGSLGGVGITSISMVPYIHERTHDILPASDTGTYLAGGALIGSTLFEGR